MYANLKRNSIAPSKSYNSETDGSSCLRVSQGILFIFNILILLIVSSIIAMGSFGVYHSANHDLTERKLFLVFSLILLLLGVFGLVAIIVGCCTVISNLRGVLISYIILLGIVALLMLAFLIGIGVGIISEDVIKKKTDDLMQKSLRSYDENDVKTTRVWDKAQKSFKCCGIESYEDWQNNSHFRSPAIEKIPISCCTEPPKNSCTTATVDEEYYSGKSDGCLIKIFKYLDDRKPIITVALVAFIVCALVSFALGVYILNHQ